MNHPGRRLPPQAKGYSTVELIIVVVMTGIFLAVTLWNLPLESRYLKPTLENIQATFIDLAPGDCLSFSAPPQPPTMTLTRTTGSRLVIDLAKGHVTPVRRRPGHPETPLTNATICMGPGRHLLLDDHNRAYPFDICLVSPGNLHRRAVCISAFGIVYRWG